MFSWIKRKIQAIKDYFSKDIVIQDEVKPIDLSAGSVSPVQVSNQSEEIEDSEDSEATLEERELTTRQKRLLALWETMEISLLPGQSKSTIDWYIKKAQTGMGAYQAIEVLCDVPWQVVACVHGLECSFSWEKNLMNGQPWDRKTTWVPKGHGPWTSWEKAAVAAFELKKKQGVLPTSWSVGETLEFLLKFNGLGYERRGLVSPYLWSFTNHYEKQGGGKYVRDGEFSSRAISKQLGAAVMLQRLGFSDELGS